MGQQNQSEEEETRDAFSNVECQWHNRINVDFATADIQKNGMNYESSLIEEESVLHVLNVHPSSSLDDIFRFLVSDKFTESKLRASQKIKPRLRSILEAGPDQENRMRSSAYYMTVGSMTTCRIEFRPNSNTVYCFVENAETADLVIV